ncbi:MAG: DegT/DnrJ/EryC1/StrS family aminotransferase [Verrucomicrobiota bacterium]
MNNAPPLLRILGGPQAFAEPLHVGRPNLGDQQRFQERVAEIFQRRWLTNDGPVVRELEARVAEICGVRHCIAMCNATIAMEIAIRALELRGEVIVPAFTFVATAHALQWQEITPVFADVNPQTHNIEPASIERLITPRTSGIIGVHVWGRACDTDALEAIAAKHRLQVMYDAAHALCCTRKGRPIGGHGRCEVLSFHATKFINSFEGGAVVTNDDALAEKMRLMRNFGFAGYDRVIYIGTNAKLTEVCAAMGLTSLEVRDQIVAANRRNYEAYRTGLAGLTGLSLIDYDTTERSNYQYVVLELDAAQAGLERDDLVAVLHAENVLARKYFWPGVHRMEPYRSYYPNAHLLLPNTTALAERIVVLPTGQSVSADDVGKICGLIRQALQQAAAVKTALRAK